MPVLRTRFGSYRPIAAPVVALGALALAAAGCGGSDNNNGGGGNAPASSAPSTTPAPAKTGGSTVSEDMTEYKFSDAKPTVKSGTVTFNLKNAGTTAHALEVEGPGGESKTGNVDPGGSDTLKVKLKAGKYEFYCPVDGHKGLGMKGEITVK
jgi:plastocyanin